MQSPKSAWSTSRIICIPLHGADLQAAACEEIELLAPLAGVLTELFLADLDRVMPAWRVHSKSMTTRRTSLRITAVPDLPHDVC